MDDPMNSDFASKEEEEWFLEEGIKLWLQLRLELPPDYNIRYCDLSLGEIFDTPEDAFAAKRRKSAQRQA